MGIWTSQLQTYYTRTSAGTFGEWQTEATAEYWSFAQRGE
jgi:hypothetical protein